MSVFRDLMYLEHIIGCIEKIQLYTKGIDEEKFNQETLIQDRVIRQLEIIGEATKRISSEIKDANPKIPWKDMAGMWDILIHDYLRVDLDIVWKTIQEYIPPLYQEIKSLLEVYK